MRIVIATGIFDPEAGGPATYARGLAAGLVEAGHEVSVLTFSRRASYETDAQYAFSLKRVVRQGRVLDRMRFFFAMARAARKCDVIYTLDWFAAGVPVYFVARLFRIPYVVRVGGDYLWEQRYLELRGEQPIPLKEFYARGIHLQPAYIFFYRLIRRVLRGASRVVFNSDTQRELYVDFYDLKPARASTVFNPLPAARQAPPLRPAKEFVFWGRFIVMKNLVSLVRAFKRAEHLQDFTLTLIGDGPQRDRLERLVQNLELEHRVSIRPGMPQKDVLERVKHCRAFVLPSWTDISPNQVMEALALGLPALVTRENFLPVAGELPATIDPHSVRDIAEKLDMLADERAYLSFRKKFNAISFSQTWNDVVRQHLGIFEEVIGYKPLPMRVLQIGADRSRRGILFPESAGYKRQEAYAEKFDALDIVGFSLRSDGATQTNTGRLRVYPTNSFSRFLYLFDAFRIARALPRPNVVSAQDPFEAGFVGWLIARRFGVPLHVQIHIDFLSPDFSRRSFENRVRTWIARFVLPRAARARAVSEEIRRSIQERYSLRAPVSVLPIYVDIERYRDASPEKALEEKFARFRRKLLVVSRLVEPQKHIALAIESFAISAPEDSCLVVVGDGDERGRLEALARRLGISERVFFEGERDPAPYYRLADLLLLPSRYEGYGLVIVEALAAGKPVLSTDVGIAREAGAIIASERDFADALKRWFENGPRAAELKNYPYKNFDEYARAYCDDITRCVQLIRKLG